MTGDNSDDWKAAMNDEMLSIQMIGRQQ